MLKSNICIKCKNKVACALGDSKGVASLFSENKKQISFQYSVDTKYDNKVILVARDESNINSILAKETMVFKSIRAAENIVVLSRATPHIQLRCMKHLAMRELRKEGVRVTVVNK